MISSPKRSKRRALKGEPLVKLHHNYLILGYGNNGMPVGEFYYNQLRSKKSAIGVYGRHLSSTGFGDIENSGFSNNKLGISGSRYSRKFTYSGKADFRHDAVNYYGFSETASGYIKDQTELNEGVDQFYNKLDVQIAFGNNQRDTTGIRHFSEANFAYTADNYESEEMRIVISEEFSLHNAKEMYTFDWALDYNELRDGNQMTGADASNVSTIIYVEPGIDLKGNKWMLEGALKIAAEFDAETNLFLYPVLDFRYNLIKSIIVPYAGITGGLQRNSFTSFTGDNPFVLSAVNLKNTDESFRGYGGIRGQLSKNTSFNLSFSQSVVKDMPLYVKDTASFSSEARAFDVVYDDINVTEIGAELLFEPVDRWRFVLDGRYFLYDPSNEAFAWHKPDFGISALTTYMLGSKIKAELLLYLIGDQKARTFDAVGSEVLKGTADINLNLEYRYTKKIGIFLDANNLASIKYERFQDYPTMGFNVLAGFKFSF